MSPRQDARLRTASVIGPSRPRGCPARRGVEPSRFSARETVSVRARSGIGGHHDPPYRNLRANWRDGGLAGRRSFVSEELSESISLDETASRRARELLEPLRDTMGVRSFDEIRQVVAELVGQCIRDSAPDLAVVVRLHRLSDDLVEVEVGRPVVGRIDTPPVDSDDAARIGFQVVNRLVDEWGVREDADQVTVWFRIHAPIRRPRDR